MYNNAPNFGVQVGNVVGNTPHANHIQGGSIQGLVSPVIFLPACDYLDILHWAS